MNLPAVVYQAGWFLWIVWFLALETLAILDDSAGDTLTERVRPWLHAHPLLWFLAAGFFAWLAIHFLAPGLEQRLAQASKGWLTR